ncbi:MULTISPECIES: quinone oxidoreductase family protein [unclassified Rhodococcus (in: high G+C Gram-positive bacteria)]|jgi:NADPH2:quinone reductase|uniref:quinone oxidoreductase family protein n=1 Tax=unclassified Rhodococcus (in: high G+C Gram-positive bacteria) TaxID=192944 RepID=UPI00048205D2|nr:MULTISPECIES: quinone oxidoreductase [unclassified Rhodococcus (in: high G+C Gram-positive bacteria)]KQU34596.1 NADPH--quinone reductase [Rhodococcus sp. Leaf225]KQU45358.1 NADPH--quinone reductase [Rhodococcus sp. Leaf258]MBY6705389.1 quinone oxidoreductase [Rhodococcus sp. BP-241]MDQ1201676.1 NADPH2:quinone reductase [Rhodococcus sp. SORGH_AS_0303]
MRAVLVTRTGGPDVLDVTDVPDPVPGPADLLVRVQASGINYIDTYFRSGSYPRELPYVPGDEGTGVVEQVGSEVSGFSVGDRVAWAAAPGSYAELVRVPAASAIAVPAGVDPPQAASVLLQGMTAHYLIESTYPVRSGDVVLVHAGAGGVGLILTQLVTAKGATVITTVSTDEKEALSREAGATHVLRYDDDIPSRVRDITDGVGVAAVYDGVGASTFDASLESVRIRGTVALFGAASGPVPPVDPQRLNKAGSVFLTRPTLAHHIRDRAELEWRGGDVVRALADGTLTVRVEHRYPLEQARQAHIDLESRRTAGSIVLEP